MKLTSISPLFVLPLLSGLAKAQETVYLANCDPYSSMLAYYSDGADSQAGQYPDDNCVTDPDGNTTWETGYTGFCTFSDSSVTFEWTIETGAAALSVGDYAGYGYNTYGTGFTCYRDDDRQLFSGYLDVYTCDSIYYCLA